MPRAQARRLRSAIKSGVGSLPAGWSAEFVDSGNTGEVRYPASVIDTIVSTAGQLQDPHILAFVPSDKLQRFQLANSTERFFRFRWAQSAKLAHIPHQMADFITYLSGEVTLEDSWSRDLKPSHTSAAALLPETSFVAASTHGRMWQLTTQAANPQQITGAVRAVAAFENAYWTPRDGQPTVWVDEVDNCFDFSGARHGVAPFPRNWKLSYPIPLGFHFDVTSRRGRGFAVIDASGTRHNRTNGHINIDPHGFTR
jgi:hypothetical protein